MSQDPNQDYEGGIGIGEYRGPGEPWPGAPSEHAPTRPFDPEQLDPFDSAGQWLALAESIQQLGRMIVTHSQPNDPGAIATGQTDGSGNAVIPCYRVAAGEEFRVSRIVVEVDGSTPSAQFVGVGFCGIYVLETFEGVTVGTNAGATTLGGLRDVAAGTATQGFLPAIFEYGDHQSPRVRGPRQIGVVISAGPVNKRVTVYYQGALRKMAGLA